MRYAPFWPFPKLHNLDSSKLKVFADDNFELDENGGKFSKRVKNTVRKGEIARYEQFFLFPQCFQNWIRDTWKTGLVWENARRSTAHLHVCVDLRAREM